jgi:hypothetical protein
MRTTNLFFFFVSCNILVLATMIFVGISSYFNPFLLKRNQRTFVAEESTYVIVTSRYIQSVFYYNVIRRISPIQLLENI